MSSDKYQDFDDDVNRLLDNIEPEYDGFVRILAALEYSRHWIMLFSYIAYITTSFTLYIGTFGFIVQSTSINEVLASSLFTIALAVGQGAIGFYLKEYACSIKRIKHLRRLSVIANALEEQHRIWQLGGIIASVICIFVFLCLLGATFGVLIRSSI